MREILPPGKIPEEILKQTVLSRIGAHRPEILVGPAVGEDATTIDLDGELLVASTDPITGATSGAGRLAVMVATNDIGAAGAVPLCVLLTMLLPEGTSRAELSEIVTDVHETCLAMGIAVAGGHSEVTPGLTKPILSVTALGKTRGRKFLRGSGSKAGDDIVVTKWAGMEGASILAKDYPEKFQDVLSQNDLDLVSSFSSDTSVVKDGAIALRCGANAAHDATEGGVLGAIYEMSKASGLGATVWADRIPIHPIVLAVTRRSGIDPLKLVSSGCLVVTHPDGAGLCEEYRRNGINAEVVGKMTLGEQRVVRDGEDLPLESPKTDELWTAIKFFSAPSGL